MRAKQVSFSTLSFLMFLVVAGFIVILVYNLELSWSNLPVIPSNRLFQRDVLRNEIAETIIYSSESCQLVKRNPWDEDILEIFDPLYGSQNPCKTTKLRTKLEKGVLVAVQKNDHCWGRCLKRVSDSKYSTEKWQNGTMIFECDIVEVRCSPTSIIEEYDYIWIHTQIYEKSNSNEFSEKVKKTISTAGNQTYDVFLLIIDSTSYTQSQRNLPKTLNYLKKALSGVEFPFLNRVAQNSQPNAVTLFLGEIAQKVDRDILGQPSLKATVDMNNFDKAGLLQTHFAENGYVTAFYEDYQYDIFNFKNSITTHENIAFRRFWRENWKTWKEMKKKNTCVTDHLMIFNHAKQFLKSYKGIPKFLTLWDTNFGHDSVSSSIEADTLMYDFFIKNRELLEKSFIIVMGDHGLRIQLGRTTKLGRYEINNPMLLVVPPKDLRNNKELMETLRENSQKLQTHHDTRETLLDILKYQPLGSYSDREPLNSILRGSSYLRKQIGERNCMTLPIPFQYCICNQQYEDIDRSSALATKVGKFIESEINNQLKSFGISKKCNTWKYKKLNVFRRIKNIIHMDVYKIEGAYEPDAAFTTMIGVFRNGTMRLGAVDRSDMYRHRVWCMNDSKTWPICDCIKKKG